MKKSWYKSKTVWFNVLAGVVAIATLFGYTGEFSSPEVADKVEQVLSFVVLIGNLFLRFKTKEAVGK